MDTQYINPRSAAPTIAKSEAKTGGGVAPTAGRKAGNPTVKLTDQQIAERAYQIYRKRGSAPGNAVTDWLEAERQLKAGL
ncbi:MAG TPA: DUF2934 domain-containing protein [Phycisphaerae bacterium]|nr:DUF2934 domain-containing protein [Phycisphaerae bacterium]